MLHNGTDGNCRDEVEGKRDGERSEGDGIGEAGAEKGDGVGDGSIGS